jgi:dTDP-4-dehydrorhamnose 3,5-epimerase
MGITVQPLASGSLAGVLEITPDRFGDDRGYFIETYNRERLRNHGIELDFVQDNQSLSRDMGTVRGLHFQTPPFAQAKLIRVLKGAIFDVALDIRKGSPSFGEHVCCELTAEEGNQLFIPEGFAHGFCTLRPDTEVFYKVSAGYAPANDKGILWNDPELGISWPVDAADAILSDKDKRQPCLKDYQGDFVYQTPT